MDHPTTPRDTARDAARQLAAQGVSNREIGRRFGVTETTVRRWRKQVAPDAAPDLQNVAPATQDDVPTSHPEPGATQAPATRDDAPRDATTDALTIALDDDLREHLAVLTEAGHDPEAAIRLAVGLLADAYLSAWDHCDTPRGTPPSLRAHALGAPCPGTLDTWSPSMSPLATCPPTRPPSSSASP